MGLELILAIQRFSNPFLDLLFEGITLCGEIGVMAVLFAVIYWTVNREEGERLAYAMTLSLMCSCVLKDLVRAPRPIGEPGVRSLRRETAGGFSFPSGHSQGAASFYTELAFFIRRRGWSIFFAVLCLLIGFSRLYLGVHFPRDVIAGLLLGFFTVLAARRLYAGIRQKELLFTVSALCFLPFLFLPGAGRDLYRTAGCQLGFAAAAAFEHRFVRFRTDVSLKVKFLRVACGLSSLIPLAAALKFIFPDTSFFIVFRYILIFFYAMGLYPLIFTRIEAIADCKKHRD